MTEKRTCKKCGETKTLNTANYTCGYSTRKKTGKKVKSFSLKCRQCVYSEQSLAIESSANPHRYLKDKWRILYQKRTKAGVYVCPDLKDEAGVEYLMSLWSAQRGLCAVTRLPMTWGRVSRKEVKHSGYGSKVSIDRIDPTAGYLRGNLQLVCGQVNYMRCGLTEEDFRYWCHQVIKGAEPPFC